MGALSRNKGKVGERELVKYLRSLGFADARRTQQYNGEGRSDVVCDESLPGLHIECKYGYRDMDLGSSTWLKAVDQASSECTDGRWVLLWRPYGVRRWRLTYMGTATLVTVVGDEAIERVLMERRGVRARPHKLSRSHRIDRPRRDSAGGA